MLSSFVGAIILLSLLIIVACVRSSFDWKLWPAIRRAKRQIREAARRRVANADVLSRQGATRISPGYLSFCITTDTDKERDLLREDPELYKDFRHALAQAGYPTGTDPVVHLSIQSQETVDRDYGGNWHEAAEYP